MKNNTGNIEKYNLKSLLKEFVSDKFFSKFIGMLTTCYKQILKKKEFFRYIMGGVAITLSNILLYTFLVLFGMKVRYANLIAMIFSKIFGYVVNKYYVFKAKNNSLKDLSKEASKYFSARVFTGVLDYFLLVYFVEILDFHPFITKYVITILVIILNYLLGKYFVFVSKKTLDSCK